MSFDIGAYEMTVLLPANPMVLNTEYGLSWAPALIPSDKVIVELIRDWNLVFTITAQDNELWEHQVPPAQRDCARR